MKEFGASDQRSKNETDFFIDKSSNIDGFPACNTQPKFSMINWCFTNDISTIFTVFHPSFRLIDYRLTQDYRLSISCHPSLISDIFWNGQYILI